MPLMLRDQLLQKRNNVSSSASHRLQSCTYDFVFLEYVLIGALVWNVSSNVSSNVGNNEMSNMSKYNVTLCYSMSVIHDT